MKAMLLERIAPILPDGEPLTFAEVARPEAGAGEVLLEVGACGVCHTELDEIEGRTPPPRLPVIPGHEVVGRVVARGVGADRFEIGQRVGVGWIFSGSGGPEENLDERFVATGRDANGGYAEYMVVPEAYAAPVPGRFEDPEAAPLLCAGAIGYRALQLTGLQDGQALGLMGFGGSAHLVLQLVRHELPRCGVYVFARAASVRSFALDLGACWAGAPDEPSPVPLDAIIDTTPAWRPVVQSLGHLAAGGRLVINAIRKEDDDKAALLDLSYHDHLWLEREIKTVANITHHDIEAFLPLAAEIPIRPRVETYALEEANRALVSLKHAEVHGAKVLRIR